MWLMTPINEKYMQTSEGVCGFHCVRRHYTEWDALLISPLNYWWRLFVWFIRQVYQCPHGIECQTSESMLTNIHLTLHGLRLLSAFFFFRPFNLLITTHNWHISQTIANHDMKASLKGLSHAEESVGRITWLKKKKRTHTQKNVGSV